MAKSSSGVKIGNVAEGAFVIALGLIIADNDLQTEIDLKPTKENVKRIMKQIDPNLFVEGGIWNNYGKPIYSGKATLKSKILDKKKQKDIPPDTLEVNLTIQLNRGEVEPFYGPNTEVNHKDWPTMDAIISQMLSMSNRYRTVIERVKEKYLTNFREESIVVDIKAMGAEGAYSGGMVKGDVTLETKITPVSRIGQKSPGRSFRLPKMSYSLKASSTPPTTISNQSPKETFIQFENKFGVSILSSREDKINPLLTDINSGSFKYIKNSKSVKHNFSDFIPVKKDEKILILEDFKGNEVYVPVDGMRKYDLLDGTLFPLLHPAKGTRNAAIKSWVINEYYDQFLDTFANKFPGGKLLGTDSEKAWSLLFDAAFGSDKSDIISFGKKITKISTFPYLKKLKNAVNGELWAGKIGNNLEFHLPTQTNTGYSASTKLFFLRYKNRTPGTDEGIREFRTSGSIELKIMIESGKLLYEPTNYISTSKVEWNMEKKKVIITNET